MLGAGVSRGGLLPGSRGTDPCLSAGSVLPRPTLSRSELCEVSPVLPPPPYPLHTLSSFPFPLFREPLPSGFWEPHVPISEGELRFKIFPSHIKPCVTVLWLPQSLRPSTVADTGPTLSNRGGSGRGPGGGHRFKRVSPGKQGFTKQTSPVDWAGPVWSGLQNESSTQGTAFSATTGWACLGRRVGEGGLAVSMEQATPLAEDELPCRSPGLSQF